MGGRYVQEATGRRLSLDTVNTAAMEAGLKACRGKALINSISLQPERLDAELPLVTRYSSGMIGLLWGPEGMPRDANERCLLAVELVYRAGEEGIPPEDIWIDPIVTPVSGEINQVTACVEFMSMLGEIAPGCKSVVGVSNISSGVPKELKPMLNRTYLIMLMRYGLYSAILDVFDEELVRIARGEMQDIVQLVHRAMDEDIDLSSLGGREQAYVKTVRVLAGKSLYSNSWLEI
jgi:5-methyltetrahydrofolate corrinoid/iron sulfur protein methyltransferase